MKGRRRTGSNRGKRGGSLRKLQGRMGAGAHGRRAGAIGKRGVRDE